MTIGGSLNSTPNTQFRVEFFSNVSCNAAAPNDFGEGQTFLGFVNVTTDGSGNVTFNPTFPISGGQTVITATATDPGNNTSEFSRCPAGVAPTSTPTNTPTSTPTNTPAGVATNTPTSTPTFTPTNTPTITQTPTRTPTVNPAAAVVPTLSPSMLGLLALALAGAAFFLMRRS